MQEYIEITSIPNIQIRTSTLAFYYRSHSLHYRQRCKCFASQKSDVWTEVNPSRIVYYSEQK